MASDFITTLTSLFECLSINKKLSITITDNELLSISDNKILTPIGNVSPLLSHHKSNLKDQFVSLQSVYKLINNLTENNALVRLNHVGFCYKVSSQQQEKERLIKLLRNSKMHLYEEPSNDESAWLFIGNADRWEDAMIELLPIEKTEDKWVEYWLPHVQIDIDTSLSEQEIKSYIRSNLGDSVTLFSIAIDGVVYIVRNRLGTIDGINITLDLATNSRNVKYQRQILLKRIN